MAGYGQGGVNDGAKDLAGMTALTEFERLEAAGNWRVTPEARAREVVVSVGDATLILKDPKSETPLSHWSLPAVTRLNPGRLPAVYGPGGQGRDERLEIDDALMIGAIERVHKAIETRRGHPGRVRGGLTALAAVAMLLAAVLWLPDALVRHATRIAPPAQTAEIGRHVLNEIERSTGAACHRDGGDAVLAHLGPRLLGQGARVVVVPATVSGARRLPGDLFVVGINLLADGSSVDALAGHLLAAALEADDDDVLLAALRRAGPRAALTLLTSGQLPKGALPGYGEEILSHPAPRPDDETMLAAFTTAGISSQPYARSVDPSGETVLGLIEADPIRPGTITVPLLTEPQWQALQQICD
ncbi:MAG: hypothetical protein Q4G22_14115 [Paracoccus sp. (in: a-proteobacteria)]|uniref:hypothetical protein n=1 Tax=Paracoccus sp. TaxID=267 RepID=UPI0026DEA1BD|nr:hypothetical protein [Paracoccus sp. (in: a-proteobacteria)]MDO5632952.1 hypothetical protein [Paracoccus sp. (in: a-proteobacteria)]